MANMSYCRFENTYRDFVACCNALQEDGIHKLSKDEREACVALAEKCEVFLEAFEEQTAPGYVPEMGGEEEYDGSSRIGG